MIQEIDIYRAAKVFIDQHGANALPEAMKKEASFCQAGDRDGATVWHYIANAIEWMQMSANFMETVQ